MYRRLLQIQREKGKQGNEGSYVSIEEGKANKDDSEYSTLNCKEVRIQVLEDLQFDFQGSFGILNRRIPNQSSHQRANSNGVNAYHRDTSKSFPKAPPTLMSSQFQSVVSGEHIKVADYLSNNG